MRKLANLYEALGYKDSPTRGFATTTITAGALAALLSKLVGLRADRGAALGTLGGAAIAAPLTAKSIIDRDIDRKFGYTPKPSYYQEIMSKKTAGYPFYDANTDPFNRPSLGDGYLDSPIVPGAMSSLLEDSSTLPHVFRNHIAASLAGAGAIAASSGKSGVTIGDVAKAGIQAGLGGAGGFMLGTFLGSRNPGTWGLTGAALTGAYSLGKSFGSQR